MLIKIGIGNAEENAFPLTLRLPLEGPGKAVSKVSVAKHIVAESRKLQTSHIRIGIGTVSVIDRIAGSHSVARGGAEWIVAGSDHIDVRTDNLPRLLGSDVGEANRGLPGNLLLVGGAPLLSSRILEIYRDVVRRRCIAERLKGAPGDRAGAGAPTAGRPSAGWVIHRAGRVKWVGGDRIADSLSSRGGIVEP